MHFNLPGMFVVIFVGSAAFFSVALQAEDQKAVPADEPIAIPSEVPLDLSDLLRSLREILNLDDIPQLNSGTVELDATSADDIPQLNSGTVELDATSANEAVQLVGADEPIVIGPAAAKPAAELVKHVPPTQPSNPLRGSVQKTEDASEELPRMSHEEEDSTAGIQIGEAKQKPNASKSSSTSNATSSPSRLEPRMVEIKPITPDEQESPRLTNSPREIDAKQSRDEDEKAFIAKRPEASEKTFVARPSTGKLSSPAVPRYNLSDSTNSARTMRVTSCLSYYMANPESVVERSPWAVMHAMLPFGVEGEMMVGNRRVNSIQWMCYNGTCRTQKLFTPAGKYFRPNVGGGVQGHDGQFLAMLAQSQVSANYPIVVGKNKYTVTDLIRYEMATCKEKEELTFKLIGLSYYIDTEQVWSTDKRNRWNIGKLVQEELAQPINGAACGGTHRLMGLTFAVRQRTAEGRPIDGQFARADRYVKEFVDYAWKMQNPDGSFSTSWFEARGNDSNMERKVQTTGHILEWLAFTVPDEELASARFAKSIDFLLSQIWDHRQNKWPIGPRGHATRAIALYHQRTTGLSPGQRQSQLAEQIQNLRMAR